MERLMWSVQLWIVTSEEPRHAICALQARARERAARARAAQNRDTNFERKEHRYIGIPW